MNILYPRCKFNIYLSISKTENAPVFHVFVVLMPENEMYFDGYRLSLDLKMKIEIEGKHL